MGGPDPGQCPICGAAHGACTTDSGPITIAQLPMRDARAAVPDGPTNNASEGRFDDVEGQVDGSMEPLGDGSDDRPFSTATYRGKKKRK
jgi:hypothetical protein